MPREMPVRGWFSNVPPNGFQNRPAELDSNKRREQYREMQQILRDDGGVIVPMFANYVQAVSTKLGIPDQVGNLWQMDNARMAERWWMG